MTPTGTDSRARIAWLSHRARPGSTLCAALEAADYEWRRPPRRLPGGAADIALIDVRRSAAPVEEARDLLARSGLAGVVVGVTILAPTNLAVPEKLELLAIGDVCAESIGPKAVVARIRNRLRIASTAEEAGERLKSALAAELPVRLPAIGGTSKSATALLAGAPGPATLRAFGVLGETAAAAVFNAGQALRAADVQQFDAVVFLPSVRDDLLLALARSLRRNRRFAGAPMFALAEDPDVAAAFGLIGVETIARDQIDEAFAAKVSRAAERARLVTALKEFLAQVGETARAAPDRAPTLFAAHALRLAERARRTGRPFSLVGMILEDRGAPPSVPAVAAAARTTASICRAEDLVLQLGEGAIVTLAPSTRYGDAMKIAARTAGVLAGRSGETRARVDDAAAFVSDLATIDAVEWRSGDTPQSLIARLFGQLKAGQSARASRLGA